MYVRHYDKPDVFIAVTFNPNWTEIKENIYSNLILQDRYVIYVYKEHICMYMYGSSVSFKTTETLTPRCQMYTIEWQKRVPHFHLLVWLVI